MQAVAANMMYTILYNAIGSEVSCISYENGEMVEYRGTLHEVLPFNGVRIDEDFVNFELKDYYIKRIATLEGDKTLYMNLDKLIEDDMEDSIYKYPKK